jgi:class 3 adenylate cyclase
MFGLADPGDEPLCRLAELELVNAYAAGVEIFGEEPTLEYARVLGAAMQAVGNASMAMFVTNIGLPMQVAGATESEYARRSYNASSAFLVVPRLLDVLVRRHFERSIDELYPPGEFRTTVDVAIGFVDLVDSTVLTHRSESKVFHRALAEFEQFAVLRATELEGRIVKLIGDEVMFVTHTADRGAQLAKDLVRFVGRDPHLAGARGAVAYGRATPRDGDYFGAVVNLAARLAGYATPGAVLVDQATADALREHHTKPYRTLELKGFDESVTAFCVSGPPEPADTR